MPRPSAHTRAGAAGYGQDDGRRTRAHALGQVALRLACALLRRLECGRRQHWGRARGERRQGGPLRTERGGAPGKSRNPRNPCNPRNPRNPRNASPPPPTHTRERIPSESVSPLVSGLCAVSSPGAAPVHARCARWAPGGASRGGGCTLHVHRLRCGLSLQDGLRARSDRRDGAVNGARMPGASHAWMPPAGACGRPQAAPSDSRVRRGLKTWAEALLF